MGQQFESAAADLAGSNLSDFVKAYILAAYWTDTGDNEQPSSEAEMSVQGVEVAVSECEAFQRDASEALRLAYQTPGYDESSAGHDFWLTRNGHGVGFWDRGLGEIGDVLTHLAHAEGQSDLYEGDDGLLYLS